VTDFSPYIAKIKASGADSVITGNWGQDFALLLKAAADAGSQIDWYTYYAGGAGGPTAIKQTGLSDRVLEIVEAIPNSNPEASQKMDAAFRAKEGVALYYPRAVNEMRMLAKAVGQAKSDDAKAVAAQLEGMTTEGFDGGEVFMRKDDHQLFQDVYIASFGPLDPGAKFDEEGTGWGWKTVGVVKANDTVLPTTCMMERP
jgi:branched-chain amino acid transport system substrate-binding protein